MGPRLSSDTDCAMKFIPSNKRWAALLLSFRNPSVWNEMDIHLRINREIYLFFFLEADGSATPVKLEGEHEKKFTSPALKHRAGS